MKLLTGLLLSTVIAIQQAQSQSEIRTMNAVHALVRYQGYADSAFASGYYQKARRYYKKLATIGDKYAQHRLAYIYANGLGTEKDLIRAYAWSYVSAESKRQRGFADFHREIRSQLDAQQLEAARELAGKLIGEAGNFSVAVNAKREIRDQKSTCTGSRTGASCASSGAATSSSCHGFSTQLPSDSCLLLGAIGVPSVVGQLPLFLRNVEVALNTFIDEYNPGRVEFGDLELLDE